MIYVTSDLHGCEPAVFLDLLKQAGFSQEDYLFILGDVIDRGKHGLYWLRWLTEQTNVQLILGNHEAMLLSCRYLFDPVTEESLDRLDVEKLQLLQQWQYNGAAPTLKAMRKLLKTEPDILEGILDYLQDCPLYETIHTGGRDYLLVHAGLEDYIPGKALEDYAPHDLLWARPSPDTQYAEDATVIFGHTPTQFLDPQARGKAIFTPSWICIDTGAACGGKPMLLRLDDLATFY